MHIAYFTNAYRPVVNGVVRSVVSFRRALSEMGHNVFIFAQKSEGFVDDEPFIFRYPRLPIPMPGNYPVSLPISAFINQLLPSLKLDVIHTHHPILIGEAGMVKAREFEIPLVFTFHSQYDEYGQYYLPIQQEKVQEFMRDLVVNWVDEYLRKCNHIIVPSTSMGQLVSQTYKVADRMTVIPTGIELAPFQAAEGNAIRKELGWEHKQVMITVGRLAPEKNFKMLIEAFAIAQRTVPELRLIVVGDGPQRNLLERQAEQAGIREMICFTGLVPLEEIPGYLKAGDFFCLTSQVETQGLVTMEAMAAGLPVVAVDAVGTRDVVEHDKTGLLLASNSASLAEGIRKICNDPLLWARLKEATLAKAPEFGIQRQAGRMLDVYRQAIEDSQSGQYVTILDD